MKAIRPFAPLSLLLGGLLFLTACDGALGTEATAELTAEDATLVSEIAAQTLADAQEGTMSDLNDLNADLSAGGMAYGQGFVGPRAQHDDPAARLWRGPNKGHRAVYDPQTGEHTIQYERSVKANFWEKALKVKLVYVFTDVNGGFIAFPKRQRDSVDAITFTGAREGYTLQKGRNGGERASQFTRDARWQATSITSGTATFEGVQEDAGTFKMTTATGETAERLYEARLQTQNVTIQTRSGGPDLEATITGQIAYQIKIKKTRGGETEEKEVEGTIELEGNGKALLRIMGVRQLYRIDLRNGDIVRSEG